MEIPALLRAKSIGQKNYTCGTHRVCDPAETFRHIAPHFASVGLTRIADVTGLDSIGIPVCNAIRPNAKSLSVSQGKGANLMLAKVSAAMEAIELYHAENVSLDLTFSSYQDLACTASACDPNRLNLQPFTRYERDWVIPWVKGFDLLQKREVFVPYDLVHCSLLPADTRDSIFFISSSGLASGNHPLEAVSHALCEVVERDATHLWELKVRQRPAEYVDLASVDASSCRELLDKLDQAGFSTYVWNMTSDVPIPAFGCAIAEHPAARPLLSVGIFHGFGCHLSKEIALSRAITEAAQSRLTYISGARDDLFREEYALTQAEFHQAQWLKLLAPAQPALDFRRLPSLETDSLEDDVAVQLAYLKRAGFEQVIVVDLSQPQIGIPVVRVIIPGMAQSPDEGAPALSQRAREYFLKESLVQQLLSGDFA